MSSDISEYKGNSNKSKEKTEKVVEKVITGTAVARKKPLGRRIVETFTVEDSYSVGAYLLFEVLIPSAKTLIMDMVTLGLERKFYGDGRPGSRSSFGRRPGGGSFTNYSRMYKEERPISRDISKRDRETQNFDGIVLSDRGEAELALDRLTELIDQFGTASVADLYKSVGITASFQDDKWGWTELGRSRIERTREGYVLDLPRPVPLD